MHSGRVLADELASVVAEEAILGWAGVEQVPGFIADAHSIGQTVDNR